ncbi:MAG: non-hydrolyzing UDP-N-acetylglucosamine 2-epimerase [Thermoleophilia bacterium]
MKIVSVVGARPQFVKAAAVSRVLRSEAGRDRGLIEYLVHTGQHYDQNMSAAFFRELQVPEPDANLGVGSGTHGATTARMLEAIEQVLLRVKPGMLLIYGDTNSTLAGALAAAKLHIPVAHVEAGLRSFNRWMPEEVNRVLADHVSSLLFCPTETAVRNLATEGLRDGVHLVGDVMLDVAHLYRKEALAASRVLATLDLEPGRYALATVHRQENTDDIERLKSLLTGLRAVAASVPVVLPLHPRTRQAVLTHGLEPELDGLVVVEPVSYLDMVALEAQAALIMTDSGGVQKEAFFFGVPCVTLRDETEWVETLDLGANRLVGVDPDRMAEAAGAAMAGWVTRPRAHKGIQRGGPLEPGPFGDGRAAERIVALLGAPIE